MEYFFQYIDLLILGLSVALTFAFTFVITKKAVGPFRKFPVFLVVFGGAALTSFMFGHLLEIGYRALQHVFSGTFVYNFRFYSLMLMGVVLFSLGIFMLEQARAWIQGRQAARKNFIRAALVVVVLSAPTVPLTPIGVLPTIACAISLAGLPFAGRHVKPYHLQRV